MRQVRSSWKSALVGALALAGALAGPSAARAERPLTIKGSDTMVILVQRWAEEYMRTHPGTVIQVTGGGSGIGIAALLNGTTTVCMASRPMKQDERLKLRDRFQTMGIEVPVALDGLTVYLHESNPVRALLLDQVRRIYTGALTNWSQVGGPNARIVLYGRESSSGTYGFFKDNVLGGRDFAAACQLLPGTAAVVSAVAHDPNGIGYGGAAYAKGVRECAIKKTASSPAIPPSREAVENGTYPIWRYLYFYLRTPPTGLARNFIAWVKSREGQAVVTDVGYFPLRTRT